MSERTYEVSFRGVNVSAQQDLINLLCGASMAIELVSINLGQISNPTTPALFRIGVKHLPATVTTGSGGSAPTPVPLDPTDAAATFTARANDTTQATTSGTANYHHVDVMNTVNGYQWVFPREARPRAKLSEALAITLETTPGGTIEFSGSCVVRELF